MGKIDPRDGVKYLTNLSLRFLLNTRLGNQKNEKGDPVWTSEKLGKFLEEHGFVKLKYRSDGKAYTYECVKGITEPEVEKLTHFDQVYHSAQKSKNYKIISKEESS